MDTQGKITDKTLRTRTDTLTRVKIDLWSVKNTFYWINR